MTTAQFQSKTIDRLAGLILEVKRPHPLCVAIDGIDAAGKTTLADELVPHIEKSGRPMIRATIDGFHHSRVKRYRRGATSPEGYYYDSFDYLAVKDKLLKPLGPNGDLLYIVRVFDYRTDKPLQETPIRSPREAILLMDGVFLLRPEIVHHWDLRIFLDVDFEVALERAIRRDQETPELNDKLRRRYLSRYIPGQRIYLEKIKPREIADVIVNNNDRGKIEIM